jgi:Holliday junction resolvase RusA-like endonuclease
MRYGGPESRLHEEARLAALKPKRLAFQILGEPCAWQRARTGNGRFFTDRKTRDYEYTVAELGATHAIGQGWPRAFSGPCSLIIDAVFPRPESRNRKKDPEGRMVRESGRKDCDNVAKAIMDGLQKGGVFKNDAQVADLRVRLWWTAKDEAPCAEVECLTLLTQTGCATGHDLPPESMTDPAVSNPSPRAVKMRGAFR